MRSRETKPPKERMYVGWSDVELWAYDIVDHMIVAGAKPEAILAIGTGGLIPAAMIARHFTHKTARTPLMDCVYAKSYHGEIRGQVSTAGIYEAAERLKRFRHAGQILIVDDMADSGSTLFHFLQKFSRAHTAVLVWKEVSSIEPTFFGHKDTDGHRWWYVWPWEKSD